MRLSIYTCIKDGLYLDFHVVEMLKHHLPLADEIVVHEGFSTDGTYEAIRQLDAKIRIVRSRWEKPSDSYSWYLPIKDRARRECTGDWCILLDADEFIPEWQFEPIRSFLERSEESLVPTRIEDFYGNYQVRDTQPICWRKVNIHRNLPAVEIWGDGANVRLRGRDFDWDSQTLRFQIHHFGSVRRPARLREKWHVQGRMYGKRGLPVPQFLFDFLPHNWQDDQLLNRLEVYPGPFVKAVRENPDEFVRDGFELNAALQRLAGSSDRPRSAPSSATLMSTGATRSEEA